MKEGTKKAIFILVVIFVIVGIVAGAWFYFAKIYTKTCAEKNCFDSYLAKCKKANFVSSGDLNYNYKILGKNGKNCDIKVEVLSGAVSDDELSNLKGKSMVCSLPLGVVAVPEENINFCHGILKEEIQDMIISKLNVYIAENVGKINYDVYNLLKSIN
jgi:hypothetical protein